ncbi:hypothetical protein [Burkholderia sp. Ac-20349]|uniref:hypothetical protein n=1 Tax=Burkholderia sp. Ac-20349 TaxID=2703893 RepID=UPI00197BACEB|nr:hypothetical protein [Burkholderia sp. Ac-20349]MBN3839286.1 hypothetical protein [Burkholderia sp. Ac-20349]
MEPHIPGDIVFHLGRTCRYLGHGRYEPIETPLEKQSSIADDEMTAGMRAAMDRFVSETP